ncbi:Lrp/AsnC family transcriptional regulator [Methanosphaerula subterraneus]|uniref:Lrp/AsnC family transcriptional regulator n=1 Tax=Methanosphaerula subterraneus TaxID=3350244 RepID=UPI003F836043
MDQTDRDLLHLLEEDSRIAVEELATMLETTAEEVTARMKALEEVGVIRKYSAVIDWERTGNGEVSAIIELKVSPERDFGYDRLAERISRFKQVRSMRLITGTYDLQLQVTGRNMQEVARFVSERIATMDQIRETATHIIMKSYKENGTVLFTRETDDRIPFSF